MTTLNWIPPGIGWADMGSDYVYDNRYWEEYRRRDGTEMGRALTRARLDLVARYVYDPSNGVDVGIGGGAFVKAAHCWGCDVNPAALDWLRATPRTEGHLGVWPGNEPVYMSFWDSIEHIRQPELLLKRAGLVFVSTPIYESEEDCRASRHFKPGEHLWYFTQEGLRFFMKAHGFGRCLDHNRMETDLGRHAIDTFVFLKT